MDQNNTESACHFSWFEKDKLLSKDKKLKTPKGCSNEPWAKFVNSLNHAYLFAVQDRVPEAFESLSEAESLLTKVPENLKGGFRLVLKNLERKFNKLPGSDPIPEEAERKIAVLVIKALATECFREFFGKADSSVKSALEDINEAYKLNTESIILKYLKAFYQWWLHDLEFYLSIPRLECFQLFFEVLDQAQDEICDRTSVKAMVAIAVAETVNTHKRHFSRFDAIRSWSNQLLMMVIEEDGGTLSAFHAIDIGFHSTYTRQNIFLIDRFFRKYIEIYPDDTRLAYRYGRFLYEVMKDKEKGEEVMRKSVQINNIDAIQGVVYLAKNLLKEGSAESKKTVEKMFDDFERRVSDSAISVRFFIHRGAFRYLVMKKKKEAFSDWLKAIEINPQRQMITAYTQDWKNTGRNHVIRPVNIMLKELPLLVALSTADERQFFVECLKKVEDFLRSRDELALESEVKEFGPASSQQEIRLLEDLFCQRLEKDRRT